MTTYDEKERSYSVRFRETRVLLTRRPVSVSHSEFVDGEYVIHDRRVLPTGTLVVAHRDTNAGFRGIECVVYDVDDPRYTGHVSTGALMMRGDPVATATLAKYRSNRRTR